MKLAWFILSLPLFVSGCLHTVNYKLSDDDRWNGPKIGGTVCVRPFADETVYDLSQWRPEHNDQGTWRINYRGKYNDTNLTSEVTSMIVKQLAYSGLFAKVVSGNATNVDYVLSGTLADFQTHGRINQTAETIQMTAPFAGMAVGAPSMVVGDAVGLAGTAANVGMKTEIKTSVKLDGLKLTDKTQSVLWQDSISITNDDIVYFAESDYPAILKYPDRALKDAVNEMIHRLGNSPLTNQVVH